MAGQKRSKTRYTGIYLNEVTKKYDIKYNFTVYNPLKDKNEYKSKWVYGLQTLAEARQKLATLRAGGVEEQSKDITLQGAYELWEQNLVATQNGSPVTIRNTQQQLRMISQFIPLDTKMKLITEDVYLKFCSDIRRYQYSDETLHSLNSCLRKLLRLCVKKRLLKEDILSYVDNMKTQKKDDYLLVSKEDFDKLDSYFANNSFKRLGVDNYPLYRLIVNLLYYTGIRIGELLALTPSDFDVKKKRLHVTKSYVSDIQVVKAPKNLKKRDVPMIDAVVEMAVPLISDVKDGSRIFQFGHGAVSQMVKNSCRKCGITEYNCHSFRHTYISNLIRGGVPLPVVESVSGDTQETILKRYSHMFASDDDMVLDVMNNL